MFKSFRFNITFRLLTIIALVLALVYCTTQTDFYITIFILLAVLVLAVVDLVRYVDQSNRDFTAFLLGIKYEDFSATYSGHHKGKSFGEMYDAFNEINRKFLSIRAEKEANHQYLHTIVEAVDVGLLCVGEDGNVYLMNKALQKLLHKPYLLHLDSLAQVDPSLLKSIKKMRSGERELLKINIEDKTVPLTVQATEFSLRGQSMKLVSMQNIQGELEEQELEAWQKLIRIIRHEIMNSITPIVSLTATFDGMLGQSGTALPADVADDVRLAMNAIKKRSEGLMHFTETYRNLTKLPSPKLQLLDVNDLVARTQILFQPVFEKNGIRFQAQLSTAPVICQADVEMLEQVIINLLKNAIDAVRGQENPAITIVTQRTKDGRAVLKLADNGPGIEKELLEQVFVPFYTTKAEGSGIGLSLSRQIMQLHKGRISVESAVGEGSVFTLSL